MRWGAFVSRIATGLSMAGLCLLSLLTAPIAPSAVATTVLFVGGTGGSLGALIGSDLFGTPEETLGGSYHDDAFQVVEYPSSLWPITGFWDPSFGESVKTGTANVESAIRSTAGSVVVIGVSQGAIVAQTAMANLDQDSSVSSDLTFVLIANPNNGLFQGNYHERLPVFDYIPGPLPETRFSTIVVINEYDGWADPISDPFNLFTVANAFMAMIYIHPFAQNSDLASVPSGNIRVETNAKGGITTNYFVPTPKLPLTMPLRSAGFPQELVDMFDSALRPLIDAGYDRRVEDPLAGDIPLQPKHPAVRPMKRDVHRGDVPGKSAQQSPHTRSSSRDRGDRAVSGRPATTA